MIHEMIHESSTLNLLAPNDIHCWMAPLDSAFVPRLRYESLLSRDEHERAARFVADLHRRRFMTARGILRLLLGHYLQADPASLKFGLGAYGKPFLKDYRLHFSVSHSGDRALFAFAEEGPIGADLERIDLEQMRNPELSHLAERVLSKPEAEELAEIPIEQRAEAFLSCWTRKEAYVKATGDGLRFPLNKFAVSLRQPARLLHIDGDSETASRWTLHHLSPEPGCVGAIATCRQGAQIRIFQFDQAIRDHDRMAYHLDAVSLPTGLVAVHDQPDCRAIGPIRRTR